MKLKDIIKNIKKDTYLYIGGSSSFFCICKSQDAEEELAVLSEYHRLKLIEYMERNKGCLDNRANYLETLRTRVERLTNEITEQEDLLKNFNESFKKNKSVKMMEQIKITEIRLAELRGVVARTKADITKSPAMAREYARLYQFYKNRIDNFVSITDAEVLMYYDTEFNKPDGIIIIVDYKIDGTSWTLDEYEKWKESKKEALEKVREDLKESKEND